MAAATRDVVQAAIQRLSSPFLPPMLGGGTVMVEKTDLAVLLAELGRLRTALRVNGLRQGASPTEIDAVVYGEETPHAQIPS
ncbi:hypothetical protein EOD42_14280 [Rhodovarius crocodyli]|uniref:Uncharacterized protein n=1 Tax=Rhodovarius crocodyli TaxID=1979269 RepID=A0A437MF77_9PROT|nr:hypothetical protein [Rhodovarius crocodyli]RVT96276.1 hypothetical protein EOD42_14280 [Rhodovarius crocodyli]